MRTGLRIALLVLAAGVVSHAQKTTTKTNGTVWDRPISFSTKSRDSCTMVVSGAGDHTRLRVSCKGPSPPQTQPQTRSYYCDFQGKPNLCRAYNTNPRHYFTQMMWDMRKLNHACQGPSVYRPLMCKKGSDEAQMTFLASWPKHTTPKTGQVQRKPAPAQPKVPKVPSIPRPVKPQPQPHPGKGTVGKKPTSRPTSRPTTRPTTRPTEQGEAKAARLANEYCWKSFHGICTYLISWFQN